MFFCGNSIFSRTTTLENLLLLFFSGVVQRLSGRKKVFGFVFFEGLEWGFGGDVFLPCIGGVLVWIISVLLLFCCFQNSKIFVC